MGTRVRTHRASGQRDGRPRGSSRRSVARTLAGGRSLASRPELESVAIVPVIGRLVVLPVLWGVGGTGDGRSGRHPIALLALH